MPLEQGLETVALAGEARGSESRRSPKRLKADQTLQNYHQQGKGKTKNKFSDLRMAIENWFHTIKTEAF